MLKLKARGNWYWVEGKNCMGVKIPRHSLQIAVLNRETLQAAERKVLELEKATAWPVPKAAAETKPQGITLTDAFAQWLSQKPEGSPTWESYSSVQRFLIEPLANQGVALVRDVTPKHLNDLQAKWKNQGKALNTIQTWRKISSCLFNFAVNFHDLPKNPWKPVAAITEIKPSEDEIMEGRHKDKGIATLPLDLDRTRKNWLLIAEHAPTFMRGQLPGQSPWKSNPLFQQGTFFGLLWLLYETGLRRSDAIIFRPDLIVNTQHGGSYSTAQVKTGDDVICFLPQPLVDQLRALPLLPWRGTRDRYERIARRPWMPGAGLYPFYDGSGKDTKTYMENHLNKPLAELGRLIGAFPRGKNALRPHRFRDSFAVNMLTMGLMLQDVQRMLGHRNVATTERYYAPYVLGVQEAVENRQAAARQAALFAEAQLAREGSVSVN